MMSGKDTRLTFSTVFLLLSTSLVARGSSEAPTLQNKQEFSDVISAGSDFSVECHGSRAISWDFPNNENTGDVSERMFINQSYNDERSTIVSRATFLNVTIHQNGWYSCRYSDQEKENSSWERYESPSSVYAFIDDGIKLFVPALKNEVFISALVNSKTVLPCATTNPSSEVRLEVSHWNKELEGVSYIPSIGFIIEKTGSLFYTYPQLKCKASFDGRSETKSLVLLLRLKWDVAPPTITASHDVGKASEGGVLYALKNETVSLECSNNIDETASSGMEWKSPENVLMQSLQEETNFYRTIVSTIVSFQKEDEGKYVCRTFNKLDSNEHNSSFVTLKYLEKNVVMIRTTPRSTYPTNLYKIEIKVMIESRFEPHVKWMFSRFGGNEGFSLLPKQYNIFQLGPDKNEAGDWEVSLSFGKAGIKNQGLYELQTTDDTPEEYTPQIFVVYEPPQPFILNKRNKQWAVVTNSSTQKIRCTFSTYPLPKSISLYFKEDFTEAGVHTPSLKELRSGPAWGKVPESDYTISNSSGHSVELLHNERMSNTGAFKCVGEVLDGIYGTAYYVAYVVENSSLEIIKDGGKMVQNYIVQPGQLNVTCVGRRAVYSRVELFLVDGTGFGKTVKVDNDESGNKGQRGELRVTELTDTPIDPPTSPKLNYVCRGTKQTGGYDYDAVFLRPTGVDADDYLSLYNNDEATMMGSTGGKAKTATAILVPLCLLALLAVVLLAVILYQKKRSRSRELEALKSPFELYLKPKQDHSYDPDLSVDQQTECLAYDPAWEVPKENLKLENVLGQGAFGRVMKGRVLGLRDSELETPVAVKMVKDITNNDQVQALLSELKIMIHIGSHLNIVNLVGAVTTHVNKGIFYVIVEYCSKGCLRNYLMAHKNNFTGDGAGEGELTLDSSGKKVPIQQDASNELGSLSVNIPSTYQSTTATTNISNNDSNNNSNNNNSDEPSSSQSNTEHIYVNNPTKSAESDAKAYAKVPLVTDGESLTTTDLVCFAYQIARGMDYLASKKLLHRDLAARNVLMAEDNVVKICDFGLAKDCYKYEYTKKSDAPVPIKWMALESLTHKVYTSKSDVWSFGVLLWEMFTFGGNPYAGFAMNDKFVAKLKGGLRLEKPAFCPMRVYEVMESCWQEVPEERPSFEQLVSTLGDMLETSVQQSYMDMDQLLQSDPVYLKPRNNYLSMKSSEDTPLLDKSHRAENNYVREKVRLSRVGEGGGEEGDDGEERGDEGGGGRSGEGEEMVDNYA